MILRHPEQVLARPVGLMRRFQSEQFRALLRVEENPQEKTTLSWSRTQAVAVRGERVTKYFVIKEEVSAQCRDRKSEVPTFSCQQLRAPWSDRSRAGWGRDARRRTSCLVRAQSDENP